MAFSAGLSCLTYKVDHNSTPSLRKESTSGNLKDLSPAIRSMIHLKEPFMRYSDDYKYKGLNIKLKYSCASKEPFLHIPALRFNLNFKYFPAMRNCKDFSAENLAQPQKGKMSPFEACSDINT